MIKAYIDANTNLIEKQLEELLPSDSPPLGDLFIAARYALLNGGKRLRPLLLLATAETLKCPPKKALSAACAIEMVHAYSLIHDDLPSMDNDDFRRGAPSLHRAFSEGHAILTGDYLLTYAFEVLAKDAELSAETKVQLIALLARASGGEGMIGGQVIDIAAQGKTLSHRDLRVMHEKKTGALIAAAVEMGALIADAPPPLQDMLGSFGKEIGLAFQIIDDLLDESSDKRGETRPSDSANNKGTYLTLIGREKALDAVTALRTAAAERLASMQLQNSLLSEISRLFIERHC